MANTWLLWTPSWQHILHGSVHWLWLWHLHVSGLGVSGHITKGWKNPVLRRIQFKWLTWYCVKTQQRKQALTDPIPLWPGLCALNCIGNNESTVRRKIILGFRITKDLADCTYSKLWSPIIMLKMLLGHCLGVDCLCYSILCHPLASPIDLIYPGIIVLFPRQGVGCIAKECFFNCTLLWIW